MEADCVRATDRRLARIAATAPDHLAAQREALAVLRQIVPFDAGSFATIDPATVLWTSCTLAGIDPDPGREALLFDNEYRQDDLHKVSALARAPEPVARLSSVDPALREQSPRYQGLRSLGMTDELRCALVDGENCWGSLELYRCDDAAPFTAAEARAAASLSGPLARLVRLSLLRQAASLPDRVDDPPGVLMVDREGAVEAMSAAARCWLDDLGADQAGALPPAVRALTMKLAAEPVDAMSMMVVRASGGWLRLHATALASESAWKASIVLEPVKPAELPATVAHVYGFTPRECDVITWTARGLSSKEIGSRLGISPFTVNDHMKAAFQKAGVQSRQQLVATLFFDCCLPLRERDAIPGPYGWFLNQESDRSGPGRPPEQAPAHGSPRTWTASPRRTVPPRSTTA